MKARPRPLPPRDPEPILAKVTNWSKVAASKSVMMVRCTSRMYDRRLLRR